MRWNVALAGGALILIVVAVALLAKFAFPLDGHNPIGYWLTWLGILLAAVAITYIRARWTGTNWRGTGTESERNAMRRGDLAELHPIAEALVTVAMLVGVVAGAVAWEALFGPLAGLDPDGAGDKRWGLLASMVVILPLYLLVTRPQARYASEK